MLTLSFISLCFWSVSMHTVPVRAAEYGSDEAAGSTCHRRREASSRSVAVIVSFLVTYINDCMPEPRFHLAQLGCCCGGSRAFALIFASMILCAAWLWPRKGWMVWSSSARATCAKPSISFRLVPFTHDFACMKLWLQQRSRLPTSCVIHLVSSWVLCWSWLQLLQFADQFCKLDGESRFCLLWSVPFHSRHRWLSLWSMRLLCINAPANQPKATSWPSLSGCSINPSPNVTKVSRRQS